MPAGLFIAIFPTQTVTGIRQCKSLFFFPFVISQVIVGLIFSWFYAPGFGLLNQVIEFFTVTGVAIVVDPDLFTYGIIAAGPWPQIACVMVHRPAASLSSVNCQWVAVRHFVSAGSILAALPPVAMFVMMQRHFIAGLTLGAIK